MQNKVPEQGKKCIRITRSFTEHFRHAILTQQKDREILLNYSGRVGGVEISNLCNHRVAKQSKAGPPGAESSGGESTMFSFCLRSQVLRTPRTRRSMP